MENLAGLPNVPVRSTSRQAENHDIRRPSHQQHNGPPMMQSANIESARRVQLVNAYHARQAAKREDLEAYYILVENNHGLARQNDAIIRENQDLTAQLNVARNDNSIQAQESEARIDNEQSLRLDAESKLTALTEERDTLKEDSDVTLTLLQGQVNALEAEQTAREIDADNKLAELEAEKEAMAQTLASVKQRCKNAEENYSKLEESIRVQQEKIETLEGHEADVAKKLEAAERDAKKTAADHKKEVEQLNSKVDLLERDLNKISKANADFEQTLQTERARVATLEKRCDQFNGEALKANRLECESSDLKDTKKKLQSDLNSLESSHAKLQIDLGHANSLSERLNKAQSESAKNANRCNTMEKTLREQNARINELDQQCHRTALERDAANDNKDKFEKKLFEECRARKKLESTVSQLRTELQQSQADLQQSRTELQQTEDSLKMISHLSTRSGTRTTKDEALSMEDENAKGKVAASLPVTPCKGPLQQQNPSASGHSGPSDDSTAPTTDNLPHDGSSTARHTIAELSAPSSTPDASRMPASTTQAKAEGEKIKMPLLGAKAPGPRSPNKTSPLSKDHSTPAPRAPTPATDTPARTGLNTPVDSGSRDKRKGGQYQDGDQRPPKRPRYPEDVRHDDRFDARDTARDPPRDPRRPSCWEHRPRHQNPYGRRWYEY